MNHSAAFLGEDGEEGIYQSNRKLPTGLRDWVSERTCGSERANKWVLWVGEQYLIFSVEKL